MTIHRSILWGAVASVMAAGFLTSAQTPQLPADIDTTSRARLPYVQRKDLNEAGQLIYDKLPGRNQQAGTLGGPLAFAAYNPGVAQALFDLHNTAVGGTMSQNAHVRELAILVACRETNYNLEWNGHEAAAARAGVDAKVIDIVRTGGALTGIDEKDAAVIRFGRQMLTAKKVDSATFAKIVEMLGKTGAMDVVAVMNTYAASGFYAIAVNEQAAVGKTPLPEIK